MVVAHRLIVKKHAWGLRCDMSQAQLGTMVLVVVVVVEVVEVVVVVLMVIIVVE